MFTASDIRFGHAEGADEERADMAWIGAMLWSCCRYVRACRKPDPWAFIELGTTITHLRLALRNKEIRDEVLRETRSNMGVKGARERSKRLMEERAPIKARVCALAENEWQTNPILDGECVKRAVLKKYPEAQSIPDGTLRKWLNQVDPRAPDERRGPKLKPKK